MSESVSFDRAASYYDRTRTISEAVLEAVIEMIHGEAAPRERCLEVGVGTGALAIPLAARGVRVVGTDISVEMLGRLLEKRGERPVSPVLGDATRLPFTDDAFGTAVLRHVLHLIPDWRVAADELLRVVASGGVIFVSPGWFPDVHTELIDRFLEEANQERAFVGLEPKEMPLLDRHMEATGATVRTLVPAVERSTEPLEEFVRGIEEGEFSFTWRVDEATRLRAAAAVRRWAEERFGSLDAPIEKPVPLVWRAYDLP